MIRLCVFIGVSALVAGTTLGLAVGAILASEEVRKARAARDRAVNDRDAIATRLTQECLRKDAERAYWQRKALVAESWLPDFIAADLMVEEVQP